MLFSNINVLLPDGSLLKNAYVATKDNFISFIDTKPPKKNYGQPYDGAGKLLLPGFINTHCHTPMTLLRGIGANLPLARWLTEAIFPIEEKLNYNAVYWGTILGIAEMLKSGVTSFNDMYFFGEAMAQAVLKTGINANLAISIACAQSILPNALPAFLEAKQLFQDFHNAENGRLKIDFSIHGEYSSTPAIVKSVSDYAKEMGANMQLHLSETDSETQGCIKRHHKTPAAYFNELGVFDSKTTAAHCIYLTKEDIDILAEKNVTVAHCPISNLKLASGIADITALNRHGVCVSIGTDSAASNDNLYMLEDIKFVPLLQKGLHKNPDLFPAEQVIEMATKNGAKAQNRKDTGAIQTGFQADLIVVDYNSIHMQPSLDMLSALIYCAQTTDIVLTMVRGKVLYKNGVYTTLDIQKTLFEINKIKKELYL